MSANHTPGPWRLRAPGFIDAPGAGYITRDVCRMDASTMAAFETQANARLIAAAPELLEALGELRDLMQGVIDGDYKPDSFTLQVADKALTKARGGQQ